MCTMCTTKWPMCTTCVQSTKMAETYGMTGLELFVYNAIIFLMKSLIRIQYVACSVYNDWAKSLYTRCTHCTHSYKRRINACEAETIVYVTGCYAPNVMKWRRLMLRDVRLLRWGLPNWRWTLLVARCLLAHRCQATAYSSLVMRRAPLVVGCLRRGSRKWTRPNRIDKNKTLDTTNNKMLDMIDTPMNYE